MLHTPHELGKVHRLTRLLPVTWLGRLAAHLVRVSLRFSMMFVMRCVRAGAWYGCAEEGCCGRIKVTRNRS